LTRHILAPLRRVSKLLGSILQPFKAVEAATRTGCIDFNKVEFLHTINSIRRQTFKKRFILSAWEQAGLYPYNPEIVSKKLESSRSQTPQPVIQDNATINPATPTQPPNTQPEGCTEGWGDFWLQRSRSY
jgi:hypothetical protein